MCVEPPGIGKYVRTTSYRCERVVPKEAVEEDVGADEKEEDDPPLEPILPSEKEDDENDDDAKEEEDGPAFLPSPDPNLPPNPSSPQAALLGLTS